MKLRRAVTPALHHMERIVDLLRASYGAVFHHDAVSKALDETLYAYHVTSGVRQMYDQQGRPYPGVYIPRKPHKNGMLAYQICGMVPNVDGKLLPYIFDVSQHTGNS